jgi:hypothetical protein
MISIGVADMSATPRHPMDVFRAAVLEGSVGGAMPQGAHAFSDVIRRCQAHTLAIGVLFSVPRLISARTQKAMTTQGGTACFLSALDTVTCLTAV